MNVGTKSLLFGVHQFLWHPWVVGRAWRGLYGCWPTWQQWICIFCHDLGYWGKPNMDGAEGKTHPERGARIAAAILERIAKFRGTSKGRAGCIHSEAFLFTLCHSTFAAKARRLKPSTLYYADKASVLFEPTWFYLLRAKASGEIWEYIDVARKAHVTGKYFEAQSRSRQARMWLEWYREKTRLRIQKYE